MRARFIPTSASSCASSMATPRTSCDGASTFTTPSARQRLLHGPSWSASHSARHNGPDSGLRQCACLADTVNDLSTGSASGGALNVSDFKRLVAGFAFLVTVVGASTATAQQLVPGQTEGVAYFGGVTDG